MAENSNIFQFGTHIIFLQKTVDHILRNIVRDKNEFILL